MADNGGNPTIIIVKRVKKGGHGHHGGAWKVAYADFVTAMMAFFLLLWLLNAVTEEQLQGISNYFAPTTVSKSQSGAGGIMGGKVFGEGALPSSTSSPAITVSLPPPTLNTSGKDEEDGSGMRLESDEEAAARHEQEQFEEAADKLRSIIRKSPELSGLAQNILVDNTAEGLRIQLVDAENAAMFPSGSSAMMDKTKKIFAAIAAAVNEMPQKISISGHTDAVKFNDESGYTNWELSADRALASRRVLISAGVGEPRITRVVGRADTENLVADNPLDPRNRRISIVLLRGIAPQPQEPGQPQQQQSQPQPPAAPQPAPKAKPAPSR